MKLKYLQALKSSNCRIRNTSRHYKKKAYSEKDGISKAETELIDAVADKTTEIKRKEYSPAVK